MSVIVTDHGFTAQTLTLDTVTPETLAGANGSGLTLDLPQTAALADILPHLDRIALIRIAFPAFNDGRGFTLARRLRLAGYKGRLHARGPVIADQYAMARRAGFDAVEIPADLAARQPADQWAFRADWQAHDYQSRLRARAAVGSTSIAAE